MTEFKKIEGVIIGKKYKPGFRFRYGVTIPCIEQEEFALCLEHDNLNIPMANSFTLTPQSLAVIKCPNS